LTLPFTKRNQAFVNIVAILGRFAEVEGFLILLVGFLD